MKSEVIVVSSKGMGMDAALAQTDRVATQLGLAPREALHMRLLVEEMMGMVRSIVGYLEGKFWIENSGADYELHLTVTPYDKTEYDRDKILGVSTSGKNAAAVGIIGKICASVEAMLEDRAKLAKEDPYSFYMMGAMSSMNTYTDGMAWSLLSYRNAFDTEVPRENNKEAWDELEKSIIGNLADDVIVGMRGGKVDIVVKKTF